MPRNRSTHNEQTRARKNSAKSRKIKLVDYTTKTWNSLGQLQTKIKDTDETVEAFNGHELVTSHRKFTLAFGMLTVKIL